jgi:hypothetical protein
VDAAQARVFVSVCPVSLLNNRILSKCGGFGFILQSAKALGGPAKSNFLIDFNILAG